MPEFILPNEEAAGDIGVAAVELEVQGLVVAEVDQLTADEVGGAAGVAFAVLPKVGCIGCEY